MAEVKKCPFCSEEILAAAKKCKHCGEWLDRADNVPQKRMITCRFCKEEIEDGLKNCPVCQELLEEDKSTVDQPNGKKYRIGRIIGKIILGIVVAYLAFRLWDRVGTTVFGIIMVTFVLIYFLSTLSAKTLGWIMGSTLAALLIATLSFHFLPERLMVFPKNHLTFSNTFIFQKDINELIERYNNASFLEKQSINQEPLVRKLMEKGIIREIDSEK